MSRLLVCTPHPPALPSAKPLVLNTAMGSTSIPSPPREATAHPGIGCSPHPCRALEWLKDETVFSEPALRALILVKFCSTNERFPHKNVLSPPLRGGGVIWVSWYPWRLWTGLWAGGPGVSKLGAVGGQVRCHCLPSASSDGVPFPPAKAATLEPRPGHQAGRYLLIVPAAVLVPAAGQAGQAGLPCLPARPRRGPVPVGVAGRGVAASRLQPAGHGRRRRQGL